jgi:DNA-binding HxlR family transcriptional regulator
MKKKSVIQVLSRSHAIEILSSLNKKPMRFLDLEDVCRSNRTRSVRLRELEGKGLVRAVPKMIERRAYTYYEITDLGKEALALAEKLLRLENERTRETLE